MEKLVEGMIYEGFGGLSMLNLVGDPEHLVVGLIYDTSAEFIGPTYNFNYINAVPEPSTYVLMLAGLGVVGFVANRRRKEARPAA